MHRGANDDVNRRDNDDVTNRRLRLFVGLIVVTALAVLTWAVARLIRDGGTRQDLEWGAGLAVLMIFAQLVIVPIRVRATRLAFSPNSAGVLICLAFAEREIVILAAAVGVLVARVVAKQRDLLKLGFNVGKDIITAAVATFAVAATGLQPLTVAGAHRPPLLPILLGLAL